MCALLCEGKKAIDAQASMALWCLRSLDVYFFFPFFFAAFFSVAFFLAFFFAILSLLTS